MSPPSGPEAPPVPAVAPGDPLEVCTLSADGRRVAGAAGVGSGLALGVWCLLPIAAGGLLGATSWLALDAPAVLLTVWVAGTGAAWGWLARRRRSTRDTRPGPGSRCGC